MKSKYLISFILVPFMITSLPKQKKDIPNKDFTKNFCKSMLIRYGVFVKQFPFVKRIMSNHLKRFSNIRKLL